MFHLFFFSLLAINLVYSQTDPRCASISCPIGTTCELQHATCKKPPCPAPRLGCVSGAPYNPCASHQCPQGQICQNTQVQCFVPPCYPVPECVDPKEATCGQNESFDSCGGCENTCENKQVVCTLMCRFPGHCKCSQGFYRHKSGKCVTEAECDKQQPLSV